VVINTGTVYGNMGDHIGDHIGDTVYHVGPEGRR
jgi:hypothetical protein